MPGVWPTVRAKVSVNALVVAQPQACAVSVTVEPSASAIIAWKTRAMVLSPATAKTHVSRAMIKLGARDRAQLVVFACQADLVTPRTAG